jgi:cobalt-zinc-cadmium efflux system outer membrane protein
MISKRLPCGLVIILMSGCLFPVHENVDQAICELASRKRDVEPLANMDKSNPPAPKDDKTKDAPASDKKSSSEIEISQTNYQQPAPNPGAQKPKPRLTIPSGLPGADAKPIDWPDDRAGQVREAQKLYPKLPAIPPDPATQQGPDGKPFTLSSLQQLAAAHNPVLAQAYHDYEAAKGTALQAGAYPNPSVFYESDNVGTSASPGYQGFGFNQLIKTAGKLRLQQASATMDLLNAQVNLRAVQNTVATQVRTNYFAVLVAHESMKINRVLAQFTDEIYRVQVDLLEKGGFAAPYEPMALRVSADQARLTYVQARKNYVAAWRQLAASLGLRDLPLSELAGRVDLPIPKFDYEKTLARILSTHTDVQTAQNTIQKARFNLQFARVTPIPDIGVNVVVQKDNTASPFGTTYNLQLSVPLAVWDQNKGNIMAAQAQLLHATEEPHRVRADLTSRLAQAFRDYEYALDALEVYRVRILPDQVRFYRGVYERRGTDPSVSFGDLVNAQQTLATAVTTYVGLLGSMWSSVVSVADLMQTDDLFQLAPGQEVMPIPDLEHLAPLPCCHPCPPQVPGAEGGNVAKPPLTSGAQAKPMPEVRESAQQQQIEKSGDAWSTRKLRSGPTVHVNRSTGKVDEVVPDPPPTVSKATASPP